ncbi:hypothetical protein PPYR_10403 [Photinus pyralis]|uniref:Uncharacterized protein n=1 Tax=Photinus pyralis TaxID=7054 RepID=A0A5N4AG65_PHOPY|nr:uncharacterized protein LOC116175128 [Photinus pyralis]KAB0796342.1 hypothetical protein PPYR_10403 [Photinus pyralis]
MMNGFFSSILSPVDECGAPDVADSGDVIVDSSGATLGTETDSCAERVSPTFATALPTSEASLLVLAAAYSTAVKNTRTQKPTLHARRERSGFKSRNAYITYELNSRLDCHEGSLLQASCTC